MSVNLISTDAAFQSMLSDVANVESKLTTEQQQLSSGNQSSDFTGMAGQAQQYLSLGSSISRSNQYLTNNQVIETRLNTTSTMLGQVMSTAGNLQSLIQQRMTGVATNSAFEVQLNGIWQSLAGQMNTQVAGQYIFGGTKTTTPPVNPEVFPSLREPGVPDDSYYLGSSDSITVRASDSITVSYNVPGNSTGFQQIIAGLVMARQGDQNNNTQTLQQGEDLVQQGIQNINSLQATVNANTVQFTTADTDIKNENLYWQGLQQTIGNTDVVAVSTQVAINQGILQAAFEAFAKINSLQLSKFLT